LKFRLFFSALFSGFDDRFLLRQPGTAALFGILKSITLGILCSEEFFLEALARVAYSVIPAEAGIQNSLKILDSGSHFACPE
jgi:hypothetical protein